MPALCKDNKEHTARIADILAQLLQAQDPSELAVVHNSVMSLMKTDPRGIGLYIIVYLIIYIEIRYIVGLSNAYIIYI